MSGTVGILNVGAGDTKLTFDPSNPAELIRAARIVKDMLRRGYALLVEIEVDGAKVYRRATDFDVTKCEYIIADFDPTIAATVPTVTSEEPADDRPQPTTAVAEASVEAPAAGATANRRGRSRRVAAADTRATAVAPSAGG